jgi:hypothetical protein
MCDGPVSCAVGVLRSTGMAKARDSLMWFGGLWSTFVTGVTLAKLAGKPVPAVAAIPVVLGGFGLTNMGKQRAAPARTGSRRTRV